jgi:hypothetical protein
MARLVDILDGHDLLGYCSCFKESGLREVNANLKSISRLIQVNEKPRKARI